MYIKNKCSLLRWRYALSSWQIRWVESGVLVKERRSVAWVLYCMSITYVNCHNKTLTTSLCVMSDIYGTWTCTCVTVRSFESHFCIFKGFCVWFYLWFMVTLCLLTYSCAVKLMVCYCRTEVFIPITLENLDDILMNSSPHYVAKENIGEYRLNDLQLPQIDWEW